MNNEIKFLTPFKRMCMTIGTLPSSFYASMSYYESMVWLYEYLKNEVIPVVNNNSEVAQELQTAFTQLENYIEHYFENLDIQEEVNTKLDEMAEDGTLADMVAEYVRMQGQLVYNSVGEMKLAENIQNGSFLKTYGFYNYNDGGGALYKARTITNEDVIDNITLFALHDVTLVAELIPDKQISAKQIGCKTDGTDNSTLLNTYFTNYNYGLYFPDGIYNITSEIDTTGNVIMSNNAWLKASNSMECMIHINKNADVIGSFGNNAIKNQEFKVNVDGDKKANIGIKTDNLHWAKLTLTAKNCEVYGVYTRANKTKGQAENTFDVQVIYDTEDDSNTATGVYINGSDDLYNNIISINTKYGVELHGGNNSIFNLHCWLTSDSLWSGSVMLKTGSYKNHITNLVVDTYETGIGFTSDFNVSTGTFGIVADYMFGLINGSFIPAELRSSYKIWDFTGLTGTAKNQSMFRIENYVGNDQYTSKLVAADNGNCPFNSKFAYKDDFQTIKWIYDLDNCPEGSFLFTGDTAAHGKPTGVSAGTFTMTCQITPTGKIQELMASGYSRTAGNTTYNSENYLPTGNFLYFYKRVLSKWNTGSSNWGSFASYYISDNYTPSP